MTPRLTDWPTDWLTVSRNVTLTLTVRSYSMELRKKSGVKQHSNAHGHSQRHQMFIWLRNLNETCVGHGVFMDFSLCCVFTANSRWQRWCQWSLLLGLRCTQCCAKHQNKQWTLSVHHDGACPTTGIPEILDMEPSIAEISMSCHHEYPEEASVVQQIYTQWHWEC
jgi:hypothetical protein